MKRILTLGMLLGAALALSACAGGVGFGCGHYGCGGSAGADIGPVGGSFGAGADRYGAGAHAGVHVGGAGLSVGGGVN